MLKKILMVIPLLLLTTACNKGDAPHTHNGYEQPVYEIIKSEIIDETSMEIRTYEPRLMAKVTVDGTRDDAVGAGFRILAAYIFGDNITSKEIPMTSPVTQTKSKATQAKKEDLLSEKIPMTAPVTQTETTNGDWVITFDMPDSYTLETLPKTDDKRIIFYNTVPEKRVNVQFSGLMSDKKIETYTSKLNDYIAQEKIKVIGNPELAYYDDPFTLPWNRRNEISYKITE